MRVDGPHAGQARDPPVVRSGLDRGEVLAARYAVERELGRGGMATVYLAEDLKLHRPVALKLLRPEAAAMLGTERFLREIEIAARLSHPHILPLYDSGETGGHLYYAMPCVQGESLRQRLEREGQLPINEVIAIVRAVASALTYAHHQEVIHRDIKPENILLARDASGGPAHPLVADFGIARALDAAGGERLTKTGLALGTPAYMSPEQAASGRLDGRSDIYALGCVAYEMLAGTPPFTGPTAQSILARHAVDPVPPLHTVRATVSPAVEAAIGRALAKVPADRFAIADEFAQALIAEHPPVRSRRKLPASRRLRATLGGAAAAIAVGTGAVLVRGTSAPTVLSSAASIAVLPFLSATSDTALTRLGKDLAVTISASLDGIGGIQAADRLRVAQEAAERPANSLTEAAALARRLGARSFLRGTLVQDGVNVRADVGLYEADGVRPLAQGITITAHRDSLRMLTDSLVWALLQQVWQRGEPPSPSLAAVTTRSLPALRAFLDGERHIEKDEWKSAALAYRSAIASDSTFWLAYFRYGLARSWIDEKIEPSILSTLQANKKLLPEREQLLVEAWAEDSIPREGELLEEVTRRFPDYWPGWFRYGDFLHHVGPLLGYTWKDTRRAFDRALLQNPRLKPAYHHMFSDGAGRDSAQRARALERYLSLPGFDPLENQAQLAADLQHMRLIDALDRSGGVISPQASALADSVARHYLSPAIGDFQRVTWPVSFIWHRNPAGQVAFNRRVLQHVRDESAAAPPFGGIAWAWAERGAWDSALAAMSEAVRREPHPREYSLAVLGAWLGAIAPREAVVRRAAASRMVNALENGNQKSELLGMLAWLDGFLAFVVRDGTALDRARKDALRSGRPYADVIDRSLAAFDRALRGERHAAALDLLALERHCAGSYWERCGGAVTPNIAAHRLSAATWLLEAGDTAQVARLLIWHEARFTAWQWSLVVRPLAYLMLARIEEARGQTPSAKEHYEEFLRLYDSPMPAQQHLVDEARTASGRLSGTDPTEIR
jgi:serine/threonine protein kinase/tetratricopeptide (TPR) repeat protein